MGRRMRWCLPIGLILLPIVSGCAWDPYMPVYGGPATGYAAPPVPTIENPLLLPVRDREFAWNQIVDTIDNYFKIEHEDRVRLVGNLLTEGRIETYPAVASTLLEPWRSDSTPGFERLQSTLQSIYRQASVHVTPGDDSFLVQVAVFKYLEVVDRPEHATVGAATPRHDGSLPNNGRQTQFDSSARLDWIRIGRDVALEQRILTELHARLVDAGPPGMLTPAAR